MLSRATLLLLLGTSLVSCSSTSENKNNDTKDTEHREKFATANLLDLPKKVATVNFDFDSSQLRKNDMADIRHTIESMKNAPKESYVVIEGHTDKIGPESYNQTLGLKRAKVVKKALIDYGLSPSRVIIKSIGESNPLVEATTWSERERNRRATIEVVSEDSMERSVSMND